MCVPNRIEQIFFTLIIEMTNNQNELLGVFGWINMAQYFVVASKGRDEETQ